MESRLSDISRMRSRGSIKGFQIKHPEKYYRQYVGIVVSNHKLIYVSAISDELVPLNWKQEPVIVCDGEENYWGVIYDTVLGKFSDLYVNGRA